MNDSALLDLTVPGLIDEELWSKVYSVLKPGAHLLAINSTYNHHSNTVGVEDSGFEIRDTIVWIYHKEHSALSPDLMLISMARKPLSGNVADNVLRWGTGGLNIGGCRVAHNEKCKMMAPSQANINNPSEKCKQAGRREAVLELKPEGRWPANLTHDGGPLVTSMFPDVNGAKAGGFSNTKGRSWKNASIAGINRVGYDDSGSASRFFYSPPQDDQDSYSGLLRYLCRLITPPKGTLVSIGNNPTVKSSVLAEGLSYLDIDSI